MTSIGHRTLMLIAQDGIAYEDNVLLKMNDGQLTAIALYGKEKISGNNAKILLLK